MPFYLTPMPPPFFCILCAWVPHWSFINLGVVFPDVFFFRRNFLTGNFNRNRSIITGDIKFGIKMPSMPCFMFIILTSDHVNKFQNPRLRWCLLGWPSDVTFDGLGAQFNTLCEIDIQIGVPNSATLCDSVAPPPAGAKRPLNAYFRASYAA